MRIQSREESEYGERIVVVPESVDDLWHLQYVLEPGDRAAGDTTRRIQREDDMVRDTGGERESMRATLSVDEVEFHEFASRLRISGEIIACSREDQLGHHHTLNVEPFDELAIEKRWKPDQVERLEDAVEASETPDIAIATVEEGAAWVHTVSQAGTSEYASIVGPTGKGEYARARSDLFEGLASTLSHLDVDAIILAGPGFTKRDAFKFIDRSDPAVAEKITVVDTSAAGDRGVHEVLARGAVDEVVAETRIAEEAALIDELMRRIKEGETAVYGPEQTAQAAEYGAVETLLVVDDRLHEERSGPGSWSIDINAVLESVEQQGGEVVVFSNEFDPGRQLAGLGGIGALLRYRIT